MPGRARHRPAAAGITCLGWMLVLLMALVYTVPAQDATPAPAADAGGSPLPARPLPQGVNLSATIDPQKAVIGDRVEYRIVIEGNLSADRYDYPKFQASGSFELVQGPSNFFFYDNRSGSVSGVSFVLRTLKTGDVTIDPARVRINGVWYETNAVKLTVEDVPEASGDLAGVLSAKTNNPAVNKQLDGRYFAKMEAPPTAYHGQAVPVEIYVYREGITEFQSWQILQNAGGNDFFTPNALDQSVLNRPMRWQTISLDGRTFQRALLFTTFVVPTRTGQLTLMAPQITVDLPTQARYNSDLDELMGMMGGPRLNAIRTELPMRASNLTVRPAPDKPAEALMQVVGDAAVKVSVDRQELLHRELVTLKINVRGEGFFDLLAAPDLPAIPNLTLVEKQMESAPLDVRSGLMLADRTFEYVYQAVQPGEFEFPALSFSIFNPRSEQQQVVKSDPIRIKVAADMGGAVQVGGATLAPAGEAGITANRANARVLGRDVGFIETAPLTGATLAGAGLFYTRPWFWALQALPAILALGFGAWSIRMRRGTAETADQRMRRCQREAAHALREARAGLSGLSRDAFYTTLAGGMISYTASLVGRPAKGLTAEEAAEELGRRGQPPAACEHLLKVLRSYDAMRYSPRPDTPENREADLVEAESLLAELAGGGRPA